MGMKGLTVWYLIHSGFAVETERYFLIFDYALERSMDGGLDSGVIDPKELKGKEVVVFVSHRHEDHFHPAIFQWREEISKLRYVISSDVDTEEACICIHPGEQIQLDELKIFTLKSTDEGVAFFIQVDGYGIYHAGDLNWWHWAGEPEEENVEMGRRYREEIDQMKGMSVDVAFVPVDPRLGDAFFWGLDYLMKTIKANMVVPMHFWEDYSIFARLKAQPEVAKYIDKIVVFDHCGSSWKYYKNDDFLHSR